MITIAVNSLPIADIMEDLAKAFNTSFTVDCDFYTLKLPEHIGTGHISGINFNSGMGTIQYNCTFIEDVELQFVVNETHPLKFLYCLEGTLKHRFENHEKVHRIHKFQEAIVASEHFNGHILRFKAGEHTVINSLEIIRSKFQNRMQCDLITLDESLQDLFNDITAEKTFYHEGFYSLKLADLLKTVQNFEGKDVLKNLFLEGMAYQMLTEQIMLYEDDVKNPKSNSILRQSEIAQVRQAVAIIKENITDLDSILDIAKSVGLNPNKLQEGFHYLYNTTVNQYIQKVRLELTKDLILNTEYNISDIVNLVGLSSKSYLSKIFREAYGTSPSAYRKQFLSSIENKDAGTTVKVLNTKNQ